MWIKAVSGRLVNIEYIKQIVLIKRDDAHELYGLWTTESHPTRQNSVIIARGDYDYCSMVRAKIAGTSLPGGQQEKAKGENEQA